MVNMVKSYVMDILPEQESALWMSTNSPVAGSLDESESLPGTFTPHRATTWEI